MTLRQLKEARKINILINKQKRKLAEKLETGGVKAIEVKERVKGGETNDIFNQILSIDAKIQSLEEQLKLEKKIITRYLDGLILNEEEDQNMTLWYVECKTDEEMEIEMCYTARDLRRKRNMILKRLFPEKLSANVR